VSVGRSGGGDAERPGPHVDRGVGAVVATHDPAVRVEAAVRVADRDVLGGVRSRDQNLHALGHPAQVGGVATLLGESAPGDDLTGLALDWAEDNRTIYLGTIAPGEDFADPDVRRVVADLRDRVIALVVEFHDDMAQDSPRLRYALACWTGLNRDATRRWLLGETTREATHEVLASTLEHVLRTFGRPAKAR